MDQEYPTAAGVDWGQAAEAVRGREVFGFAWCSVLLGAENICRSYLFSWAAEEQEAVGR